MGQCHETVIFVSRAVLFLWSLTFCSMRRVLLNFLLALDPWLAECGSGTLAASLPETIFR